MGIKKNPCVFLFYIFCLVITIILYGGFMFYFCTANPYKTANIIYAAENDFIGNVESNKDEISGLQKNNLDKQESKELSVAEDKTDKTTSPLALNKEKERSFKKPDRYNCSFEFYIGQSISFYQQIITLLLGVIGILLVISFIYLRFTSRQQAEEMANEALNSESFKIVLQDVVKKQFAEAKKSDEFVEMYEQIPILANRVDALEKIITTKADDEIREQNG